MAFVNGTKVTIKESAKGDSDYRKFFDKNTGRASVGEVNQTLGNGRILVTFPQGNVKCQENCLALSR